MSLRTKQFLLTFFASALGFAVFAAEPTLELYASQAFEANVTTPGGWSQIRKCGERVDFEIEFKSPPTNLIGRVGGGKAKLVIDDFGSRVIAERNVDFVPGVKYAIGGTLDKPGFLRLRVEKNGIKPNFGGDWQRAVAFEPEKIEKTTPMPDDFDGFWSKARARAAAIPLDVRCEKNTKCRLKEHDEYLVSFAAPNGRRVYGYFRKPKDASVQAPLRVQVPGAGLGAWSMRPPQPKKGEAQLFMTVFPWAPWEDGNAQRGKFAAMIKDFKNRYGYEAYYLAGLSDGLDQEFYYAVMLGIDRAITWAASQEGVDGNKVFYYGISQGGGFGLYLAYLNPHIKRAVVNVPGFADMLCVTKGMQPSVFRQLFDTTDEKVLAVLKERCPYFDTANFAARLTIPIRFVTGQQDWVCPPHTVYAAYNACPSPDKAIFFTTGGHQSAVEEAEGRAEEFLKGDLPAPSAGLTANDEWVTFPFANEIRPGSILDFSRIGTLDAPAGKYGFVRVGNDGHFAFEKRSKAVRFVGGNLCFDANFISKEECKKVVEDFVRRGWNTVRFHHIDITITKDQWNRLWERRSYPEISSEQLDRLDYLMSEFKKSGIYATFDLYTMGCLGSCDGFDKPLNSNTIKAIVPIHRPAEDMWFKRAMEIFDHVNPYTGMKWKDDPAILFVTLMNEDSINSVWRGASDMYFTEYEKWAKANGRPTLERGKADSSKDFAEFLFTVKAAANRRMSRRLKNAGVRCLMTGGNWWDTMQQTYERDALEVVDNHGYGDHPQPGYQKLPFHVNQTSDIRNGNPTYDEPIMKAPSRIFGKPFTVTEYNFCPPNRYRADGGIMMGAYASLQNWDALYRFAWSHSKEALFGVHQVKGFDVVRDPVGQLTERQIVLMFGRGDVSPARNRVAYAVGKEDAFANGLGDMWSKGLFPDAFTQYAMVSQIGSFVADHGGRPALRCSQVWDRNSKGTIPRHDGVSVSDTREIRIDTRKGDITVATPKTAAVTSIGRNDLTTAALSVSGATTYCSVSASAMDDASLVSSKRVLIFHITDVLNSGMEFTDHKMTDLKNWGRLPYLAKAGKAEISVRNNNAGLKVFALASDGSRLREVKSTYSGGVYRFTAEIKAGEGANVPTMMYELSCGRTP